VRLEGQVSVFRMDRDDSPCYACLYRDTSAEDTELCSQFGVLAPVAGVIGTLQATETLKLLLGIGESLAGRLLLLDALAMEWRSIKLKKDPACPVCGSAA
jgi:molybdopterin-synthase adenylyltransferase